MREESKKYVSEAYDIIKHAAEKIGSRLPGSDGEKAFSEYMAEKLEEIGIKPVREEFAVSPRASIGGIPYSGWFGLILSGLCYVAPSIQTLWYGMALSSVAILMWLIFSVFLYKKWFDMFFKREISQNVYGELLPPDGKYDYTIFLSGHTDTSWTWKHSENTYKYRDKPVVGLISVYGKVGFGAVCVFFLIAVSIAMSVLNLGQSLGAGWAENILTSASYEHFSLIMIFLPIITAIGSCFLIMWADPDPRNASRGAMDNASGISLSYAVTKYFHDHPDEMPKNCRIVDLNIGSEEAGLRGSLAFTAEHKNDGFVKNSWNINVDSIADDDYFEVITKDDWQFCSFDKDLSKMFTDTFKELSIESKTNGSIHNPVGGCDSTPMTKAGLKSVTFAAQNPILTYYYHTWRDMPDRFSEETVGKGFDVMLGVISKIDAYQQEKGFTGVNN